MSRLWDAVGADFAPGDLVHYVLHTGLWTVVRVDTDPRGEKLPGCSSGPWAGSRSRTRAGWRPPR